MVPTITTAGIWASKGPTDDPGINGLRERQMRNFLTTLLMSQGVPMLLGGDEFAHTQEGNNNGYCQDNQLTWFKWELDDEQKRLLEFTTKLIALRKEHPNLHRRRFFQDRKIRGSVVRDVAWYGTDGNELSDQVWNEPWSKSIGVMLNGHTLDVMDEDGEPVYDDSFLILVNASEVGVEYVLPDPPNGRPWRQVLDTENVNDPFCSTKVNDKVILGDRSVRVYCDGVEQVAEAPVKKPLAKTL